MLSAETPTHHQVDDGPGTCAGCHHGVPTPLPGCSLSAENFALLDLYRDTLCHEHAEAWESDLESERNRGPAFAAALHSRTERWAS